MSDLIDRQAALDAIRKCMEESVMPKVWYNGMEVAVNCIHHVPTAQPEIIRCRECRHYDGGGFCTLMNFDGMYEDDFCSYAERRTE